MVWQPTAESSVDFNRAWRYRINSVPIGMFEMVLLLAVWVYLVFGIDQLLEVTGHAGALDRIPLWGDGVKVLGTLGLLLYVTKVRKLSLAYLGFERPHWKSDSGFALILACLAGGLYALLLGALALAIHYSPESFNARSVDPIPDVMVGLFGFGEISWMTFLSFVILAPIMEEIWFRGWMYPVVRKHFGPAFSVIAVALIFGFAHGGIPISQIIGGLIFTYAYEKRPNLYPPILLHMAGNGSLLVLSWIFAS